MLVWTSGGHDEEFLYELLRHEGRGDNTHQHTCSGCQIPFGEAGGRMIQCRDCFGGALECIDCCLKRHAQLPLHRIQVCST